MKLEFTTDTPYHDYAYSMPTEGSLALTGTIKPAPESMLEPKAGYRLFGLALASKYNSKRRGKNERPLPREWQLFEVLWRNGQLIIEFSGYGPKRNQEMGGPMPWKAGRIDPAAHSEGRIPFRLEFDGSQVEALLGHSTSIAVAVPPDADIRHHRSKTALTAKPGDDVMLYAGMDDPNADLKPPIGFELEIRLSDLDGGDE